MLFGQILTLGGWYTEPPLL